MSIMAKRHSVKPMKQDSIGDFNNMNKSDSQNDQAVIQHLAMNSMIKNKSTIPKHIANKLASRNSNAPTIAIIPENEDSKQEATMSTKNQVDDEVIQNIGNP